MHIRLSAKRLGEVSLPNFCPRCFWLRYQLHNKVPYSAFPSIFGTIDRHTKEVVHSGLNRPNGSVSWLKDVGDVTGYIDPPRARDFQIPVLPDFVLSGEPDGILKLKDGTIAIVDYKTAFCAGDKDPLLPIYHIQLNCYALLAEAFKLGSVSKLMLLYTEPVVGNDCVKSCDAIDFALGFKSKSHEIPLDRQGVITCINTARSVLSRSLIPDSRLGCEECLRVQALSSAAMIKTKSVYAAAFPAR